MEPMICDDSWTWLILRDENATHFCLASRGTPTANVIWGRLGDRCCMKSNGMEPMSWVIFLFGYVCVVGSFFVDITFQFEIFFCSIYRSSAYVRYQTRNWVLVAGALIISSLRKVHLRTFLFIMSTTVLEDNPVEGNGVLSFDQSSPTPPEPAEEKPATTGLPPPPPNGGLRAWLQVVGGFLFVLKHVVSK